MKIDQELYRGILAYEETPVERKPNPDYNPYVVNSGRATILVPSGPEETREICIGAYSSISPIKSYVTRHRGRHKNLRVVRFERVSAWEEVI